MHAWVKLVPLSLAVAAGGLIGEAADRGLCALSIKALGVLHVDSEPRTALTLALGACAAQTLPDATMLARMRPGPEQGTWAGSGCQWCECEA